MNQLKTDKSRYWIAANLRGHEVFSETAFERYSYNARSEVIGSQRFYGSDITDLSHPVTGRSFGYGYDPIGNRVSSFEDVGGERLETTYTANELNQYTAIQNASAVPLRGDAKRDAIVTVNGNIAKRDAGTAPFTPWSYSLPSGAATSHFQNAAILAVAQNAAGENVEQRESGSVFVPAAETLPTYDDDGNMTFDGRFRYSWNGENRMIRAEETLFPTNRAPTIITYAYDHQGRMVSKIIAGTNSVARSLIWDGYNIVRETDNGTSSYNIWGLDLDRSLQGCGGVSGLLAVCKPNGLHLAFYDANGNTSEYVSQSGSISAYYEYSPFGRPLLSQGDAFTHQFSTKPYCSERGIIHFESRELSSIKGRWLSRDSGEEYGGINLYVACGNDLLSGIDFLGYWKAADEEQSRRLLGEKYPARKLYIREDGDTIQSLADEVGLDANEAASWARFSLGHSSQTTQTVLDSGSLWCYVSVPNVWIDADLLRGGFFSRLYVNPGGSIGSFFGTDLGVFGKKVITVESPDQLVNALQENTGDIWGLTLYAHGSKDGFIMNSAYEHEATHQLIVFSELAKKGYRLPYIAAMQCYSGFAGKTFTNVSQIAMILRSLGCSAVWIPEKHGYEIDVDWQSEWEKYAIRLTTYSGINIFGFDF